MASPGDEARDAAQRAQEEAARAREDARHQASRAREEAMRARDEAHRIRDQARADAHRAREEAVRLRDEARKLERRLREDERRARGSTARDATPDPDDPVTGRGSGAWMEQQFTIDGVRDVSLDQTAGNLTVRMCEEGGSPGVVATNNKGAPELEVRREGDRLIVEVHMSKGWLFRRKQGPTTVVRLWEGLSNVKVNLGYGEVHVRDVVCDTLRIDVGAGATTTFATVCNLRADVSAGKLTVNGHRGLASCHSGTGDVLLDIAEVAPGDYSVDVGMGRAEVRLPEGAEVNVKTSSGIGKARSEFPSAPDTAASRLKMNTGIGEVVVRAREHVAAPAGPSRPAPSAKPQRPSRPGTVRRFEAEEMRVLQMLEQGRISSQDAADLIAALQGAAPPVENEGPGGEAS
jgi:hypothetical protein